VVAGLATTADAKCTRLGFSVNDYGKDGPTKDAKQLLDKYIAEWTAKHGIKQYTVGKKDVTCELFLDFVVFDEHTCKATALVCWPGTGPAYQIEAQPGTPPAGAPAQPKSAAAKAPAPAPAPKASAITTGTVSAPAKAAPVVAPVAPVAPAAAGKAVPAKAAPVVGPVKTVPAVAPAAAAPAVTAPATAPAAPAATTEPPKQQ
jgi:hypothetical protein